MGLTRPKDSGCWLSIASKAAAAMALPKPVVHAHMMSSIVMCRCCYKNNACSVGVSLLVLPWPECKLTYEHIGAEKGLLIECQQLIVYLVLHQQLQRCGLQA